jgi:hypothetical protein
MFKLGDEVIDFRYGADLTGVVTIIRNYGDYRITVNFGIFERLYNLDGTDSTDNDFLKPVLYPKGTEFIIKEPKKSKWVNLYWVPWENCFETRKTWDTEEEALRSIHSAVDMGLKYIKTIEIKPEDYDGKI